MARIKREGDYMISFSFVCYSGRIFVDDLSLEIYEMPLVHSKYVNKE